MKEGIAISRRLAMLAAAGLATLTIAGAVAGDALAQSTLEKAREAGFIRIGFANEAPYGFATPDGKLTGEAPEVAKAGLKKMGIKEVDGGLNEFGALIPGLKGGRIDIIAAGMFVTHADWNGVGFTGPSERHAQGCLGKE